MTLSGPTLRRVIRFGLTGGVGFLLDLGVLAVGLAAGLSPMPARLLSMAAAVLATWRINRRMTFGPSERSQFAEGARYASVLGVSCVVNFGLFVLLLGLGLEPLVSQIISSGLVTIGNYILIRAFVFERPAL